MNVKILIDAIVRQTTVLIAQLATAAGIRAPLAHIANQVFLELVTELEAQGVGRKVIADMFGLALRSYQLKVRRISESTTEQNRTLWEAVYNHVQQRGLVSRADLLLRFVRDDESVVRSILHDMVESGLLTRQGRGDATAYRAADPDEVDAAANAEAVAAMVWVYVYRKAPILDAALIEQLRLPAAEIRAALDALTLEGRIDRQDSDQGPVYRATTCVLPMGSPQGWEAALFDHYQAMVHAFANKLGQGHNRSLPQDVIGGSTWSFDVWDEHPHKDEVYGLLRTMRAQVSELRGRVTAYNQIHRQPGRPFDKITFYVGQNVRAEDPEDPEDP